MDEEEYYERQLDLQQRQIDSQSTRYAPQLAEQVQQAQAVLVEQTNPNKVVKEIMMVLEGKEENEKGDITNNGSPLLNELGLRKIWVWCKGAINQGVILSHYEKEEIGNIMEALQQDLVDELALNWRDYGIKNKTDLDLINNIVLININSALKRALGQNEKNWLGKISIEQISSTSQMRGKKKDSFWSKFRL